MDIMNIRDYPILHFLHSCLMGPLKFGRELDRCLKQVHRSSLNWIWRKTF